MQSLFRPLIIFSAFVIASTAALTSHAQTLETVTVTAQRQPVALNQLGINTGVVSESELTLVAHTHINESLTRVPGAWISRGNGQEHLTAIRSPVLTGAGGCGAFLMAEDGLALRAAGFCNLNQLFEVNSEQARQIEVVRGPSSATLGSNAVHGVINVLSYNAPEQNETRVGLEAGPDEYYRVKAHQAFKGKQHSLRIYANGTSDGGYKDDSGFDQQKLNVSHYFSTGSVSIKNHLSLTNLNQETAGFINGRDAYKDNALKRSNPNPEAFRDAESARFYSQINIVLSDDASLMLRPFARHSEMRFLQHFLPWQPVEENGVDSVGLQTRYTKRMDSIDLSTGVDLEYNDGFLREVQAEPFSPNLPAGVHYDYDVTGMTFSPFVSLRWAISSQTDANFNLRFDSTAYDYTNNTGSNSACANTVTNCRFSRPSDRSDRFSDWSPSVSLLHRFSDNMLAYANASRGFRAPQATELYRLQVGQLTTDLDSEQLDSIELGMRGTINGTMNAARYDIALFSMRKKDFLFQDSDRQNISGGKSTHQGVELDLGYQLSEQVSLNLSGTWAEHLYDSNINISRLNINGNDIDTAPRYSGNLRLSWQPSDKLFAEAEWYKLGSYFQNPENTVEYGGHDLLNLRAAYQLSPRWKLSARLVNTLDTDYAERADFGFGNNRYFVGQPRSLYVGIEGSL
ncbi:MAG: TonB-dependent receptor [Pseudomonadales bacterium]